MADHVRHVPPVFSCSAAVTAHAAADPAAGLPEGGRLNEYAGSHTPRIPLNEVLTVVSQQEAADLFAPFAVAEQQPWAAGAAAGSGSSNDGITDTNSGGTSSSGGDRSSRPDGSRRLLGSNPDAAGQDAERVVQQVSQPVALQAVPSSQPAQQRWAFDVVTAAVGLQPFLLSNWWHTMDGE